jgi:alpha-1,3-rhamnosyl/mannosyltransferase
MRVLFNGVSTLRRRTGVGHTAWQLYQALVRQAPNDELWFYPGNWWQRRLEQRLNTPVDVAGVFQPARSAPVLCRSLLPCVWPLARWAYACHFHISARWGRFDLYHEPNLVPFMVSVPTVVTVHDLSVLLYPHWHPAERVRRHERAFALGVARAAHILVDTEAVRQQLLNYLAVEPERVTTVPCGIHEHFRPVSGAEVARVRRQWQLPSQYVLYVGTIEPRKNVLMLMQAYCDLPPELRSNCPLVLVGAWGWKSEPERHYWESVARYQGVRHMGYVPDQQLPALYSGALALFYPSHYEGFGLPPLEMMACGGAAIVSTAAALRETAGGNAVVLPPDDLQAWRQALVRTITQPEWLDDYRRRGPQYAAGFRWDHAAQRVLQVYRRTLGISYDSTLAPPLRSAA